MNSIPNEVRVKILSCLPGNSVPRFERLSPFYGDLIKRNQKFLSKPTVSLTIGLGFCSYKTMFNIRVKETDCQCYFGSKGELIMEPREKSDGIMAFEQSFLDFASRQPGRSPQNKLFFKWLLGKHDLEFLEFEPYGETDEILGLLEEAMEIIDFRCPLIIMKHGTHSLVEDGCALLAKHFLPTFCEHQRKLKVNTQLRISDTMGEKYNYKPYKRSVCADCCSSYSDYFDDVLCENSYSTMMLGFQSIIKTWNNGYCNSKGELLPLKSNSFRVRYHYGTKHSCIFARSMAQNEATQLIQHYTLENLTEEQILEMLYFETFEKLPEEIILKRRSEDKRLKIKLTKEEKSVMMTVEIE